MEGNMSNYSWVSIYQEFSNDLLRYKNDRKLLLHELKEVYDELNIKFPFTDHGEINDDVCPFSVMACFNKRVKDETRYRILQAFKNKFSLKSDIPTDFDAIPVLLSMSAWFFSYKDKREDNDIDNLWALFEKAIEYADNYTENVRDDFISIYNEVLSQRMVRWNITVALFWVRPQTFLNLDSQTRNLFEHEGNRYYDAVNHMFDTKKPPQGKEYLNMIDICNNLFQDNQVEENSFLDLSHLAFNTPFYDTEREVGLVDEGREKHYWIYSAGPSSSLWEEFFQAGIMAIGWDELGDISQFENKSAIANKFRAIHNTTKSYKNDSLALYQFVKEIQVGDIVYVKKGVNSVLGRGVVESEYLFDDNMNEYKNTRKVNWTHKGEWPHPNGQAVLKTLTDITQYVEYVKKMELLFEEEMEEENTFDEYSEEDFLKDVFISPEKYAMIQSLLKSKKNIIIQGPPGVGKTYSAKRIAYSMIQEKDRNRVQMIQFHQSYSYEDFIMGYRPTKEGFELMEGPFYQFCRKAEEDNERDYFFIIDEINRGNLSKIFGELLMLIEQDKRGQKIKLMYRDEQFNVPKNVYLIGLMNTADRSLAMIDYALRRRFAFIDFEPEFDSDGYQALLNNANNYKLNRLIREIQQLNQEISLDENLGEGFLIGHSYFCQLEDLSGEWFESVIKHEIIPLIREYWFDEKQKITLWSNRLLGVIND
jgi:5-methylcytosine-specific restriction protein B